ncbi:hypothetical protein CGLO_07500 [Colletotrichum gloeosporioides Cg-14]|uniref:Uncharacterized protein n=1 Tax=Colletotrichum gloeosporioides (strain Cg-14) TaxID=1237896 RepID=T0LMC3_COLGC|nr:hypothetical protein CGLO_07500 [Colletotrichum gloeosporioides Cg-14]
MRFWPPNLGVLGRQTKSSIEGDYKRSREETRDTMAVDSVTPNGWVLVSKRTPPTPPSVHPQMSDAPDVPPEKPQGGSGDAKLWTEEEIYDLHRVSKANAADLRRFVNFGGLYSLSDNRTILCIRGHEELMDIIEAAKVIRNELDEPFPGRRIFLH